MLIEQYEGVLRVSKDTVNNWRGVLTGEIDFKNRKFIADGVMSFTFKDGAVIDIELCNKDENNITVAPFIKTIFMSRDGKLFPCVYTKRKKKEDVLVGRYVGEVIEKQNKIVYTLDVVVPRNQGVMAKSRNRIIADQILSEECEANENEDEKCEG